MDDLDDVYSTTEPELGDESIDTWSKLRIANRRLKSLRRELGRCEAREDYLHQQMGELEENLDRAKRIIGRLWPLRRKMRNLRESCEVRGAALERAEDDAKQLRADLAAVERMNRAADEDRIRLHADLAEARAETEQLRHVKKMWNDLCAKTHGFVASREIPAPLGESVFESLFRGVDELRADLAEARARIDKARSALDYDLRPLKDKPEKYDAIWRANQRAYLALVGAGGREASIGTREREAVLTALEASDGD